MAASSNSRRPDERDLSQPAHWAYVDRVEGECVISVLTDQLHWMCELGSCLSAELVDRPHPPFTWTVRQVFEHCVNAERIFGDRMLRIAAGDAGDLPAWDENAYADSRFGLGNIGHLISEMGHLRQANSLLLNRMIPAAWNRQGRVDSHPVTPRGIAWLAAGHIQHHFEIIERRCELSTCRKSGR